MIRQYNINAVKQRNPIEEVISRHGIVLLGQGSRMAARCPFHDDHSPSLVVYPQTSSFYCFGCGAAGDVIDFVRRFEGLGFRAAIERLEGSGDAVPDLNSDRAGKALARVPRPVLTLDDWVILTAACTVYHDLIWRTPKALTYLEARGINAATIKRCRLGYSDGHSLREYLQRHRLSLRRAKEMGLLWRNGGERMVGRIIVPEIRSDQCTWMVGRHPDDASPKYRGLALPKPILGYDRVRAGQRVYLTEGTFDYLTGVDWSLPICALQGIKVQARRLDVLKRAQRVFLVFDNDDRGREAEEYLTTVLGGRAHVVRLPEGTKDLNALGQQPDGRETFFRLVRAAEAGKDESHAPSAR